MKPLLVLLVCALLACLVWMLWPATETRSPGLPEDTEAVHEAPNEPLLTGRGPPPPDEGHTQAESGPARSFSGATQPGSPPSAEPARKWAIDAFASDAAGNAVADVTIASGSASWRTAPSGHAELAVPTLPHGVHVKAPDGWWHDRNPVRIHANRVHIVMRRANTFDGLVLDPSGSTVPSAVVDVQWFDKGGVCRTESKAAVTDGRGGFRLNVPEDAGGFIAWAFPPRQSWDRVPQHAMARTRVRAGEYRDLELRFELGERIEGVVVDLQGDPVLRGSVAATPIEGVLRKHRVTRLDGTSNAFTFAGLAPGPYWVKFHPAEPIAGVYSPLRATAPSSGVRLAPTPLTTLTGRVVGTDVVGLNVVWFRRVPGNKWFRGEASGQTSAEGTFKLTRVAAGDTRLLVRGQGQYALLENVSVPQAGLDVRLHPAKTIRGRFEKPTERHRRPRLVGASRDGLMLWGSLKQDGTFSINLLPPGFWTLHWAGQGRTGTFTDYGEVEAGRQDVVLPLPAGH